MSVYIERVLSRENKAFTRNLARRVLEKECTCCVCGDHNVSIWIFDNAYVANGCLIFARLFCKEHEKRWKNGETLNYEKFNGVLFLEMPYQNPAGLWINMSWSEFMNFVEAHAKDDRYVDYVEAHAPREEPFASYLTKNTHLVFEGKLKEFLKEK